MGDIANLASRLESLSKHYGTRMLVSGPTATAARGAVISRPVDVVAVKGKVEGVRVYELLTTPDAPDAADAQKLADAAEGALARYLARDFAGAEAAWRAILHDRPGDAASQLMADRAGRFAKAPPPDGWTGVYEAESK
jgi:adenylate cyclase